MTKIIFILIFIVHIAMAGSVVGSKHDLSVTNYYGAYGTDTAVCVFCHTPHAANTDPDIKGPIWNRLTPNDTLFTLYGGGPGLPNPSSMLCLSCHDGVGNEGDISAVTPAGMHTLLNNPGRGDDTAISPNCKACHGGPFGGPREMYPNELWRIGPNLTDDHPISISYDVARTLNPSEFLAIPAGLPLYNDMVECSTCHDVHNPDNENFLRVSNTGSTLCSACHIK